MLKKLKKIVSCNLVFLAYRICLSVLEVLDLNQQQLDGFIYRLHRFCRARIRLDVDKNYWSKCQIYRKQVYSRKLYKYELTALHIITE